MKKINLKLRPDSKGRIGLGDLAKNVSSFTVRQDHRHRIILEPNTEIPVQEKWLFENKLAQKSIQKGLADAASGKIESLGSFSQYADDDID